MDRASDVKGKSAYERKGPAAKEKDNVDNKYQPKFHIEEWFRLVGTVQHMWKY